MELNSEGEAPLSRLTSPSHFSAVEQSAQTARYASNFDSASATAFCSCSRQLASADFPESCLLFFSLACMSHSCDWKRAVFKAVTANQRPFRSASFDACDGPHPRPTAKQLSMTPICPAVLRAWHSSRSE